METLFYGMSIPYPNFLPWTPILVWDRDVCGAVLQLLLRPLSDPECNRAKLGDPPRNGPNVSIGFTFRIEKDD